MPLPGSQREKFLSEVAGAKTAQPEFLQEIKLPKHDVEQLDEQPKAKKPKRGRKKKQPRRTPV